MSDVVWLSAQLPPDIKRHKIISQKNLGQFLQWQQQKREAEINPKDG